jgi:hypothetical protein
MSISTRHALAIAAGVATFLIAPASMAAGAYHPEPTEAGASFNPDHATQKTREQVNAELAAAKALPNWDRISRSGAAWPAINVGPSLTREQVAASLQAAMSNPAWDRISRTGAAWPSAQAAALQSSSVK